jgi:hypothetical protein
MSSDGQTSLDTHARPPLPLEAWLRSNATGTIELPAVRRQPARRTGELKNVLLCLACLSAFGIAAGAWIHSGASQQTTTTTCSSIVCPQQ